MSKKNIAILTIILAVLLDQFTKIYIKTHFALNESVKVFDWFQIYFVENNGMAMGIEFGGSIGKLLLTLFRILVVPAIIYWLITTLKKNMPTVVVVAIALIFSGAIGNIIDSVFYGVIFDAPQHGGIATLFADEPYGSLFHGKVVDMFYFPIIQNATWPGWVPFIGGDTFSFFPYIFNFADAYITAGVILLFLFSKKAFPKEKETTEKPVN